MRERRTIYLGVVIISVKIQHKERKGDKREGKWRDEAIGDDIVADDADDADDDDDNNEGSSHPAPMIIICRES